jgi:hypothetical protein
MIPPSEKVAYRAAFKNMSGLEQISFAQKRTM